MSDTAERSLQDVAHAAAPILHAVDAVLETVVELTAGSTTGFALAVNAAHTVVHCAASVVDAATGKAEEAPAEKAADEAPAAENGPVGGEEEGAPAEKSPEDGEAAAEVEAPAVKRQRRLTILVSRPEQGGSAPALPVGTPAAPPGAVRRAQPELAPGQA